MPMVSNARESIGRKYGMMTVLSLGGRNGVKIQVVCRCDCGNIKTVNLTDLKYGHTKSCGCYWNLQHANSITTHGMSRTRLYHIWGSMIYRCNNPNSKDYKNYGLRGIAVCNEWKHDYTLFHDWAINNGYSDHLSIDRINVDGDYTPDNCRWATNAMQMRNRRIDKRNTSGHTGVTFENNRWRARIKIDGKYMNLASTKNKQEAIDAKIRAERLYWGVSL